MDGPLRIKDAPIILAAAVVAGVCLCADLGLCDAFKYESHGRRDPFVPLVGQEKPSFVKLEDITSAEDLKLEGIASGSGTKMIAFLSGELVKEGQRFGDIMIDRITRKTVVVSINGKSFTLNLLEQEGGHK